MQHESQISLSTLNSRLQYQILQFIINATKSFRMLCIHWSQRAGKEVAFLLEKETPEMDDAYLYKTERYIARIKKS